MTKSVQLLVFTLDAQRYALGLAGVERVVCVVAVTPLPDAPEMVLGIINIQGRIAPVINLRHCFRLQERTPGASDQFILVSTAERIYALATDAVHGVVNCPAGVISTGNILPRMELVEGVMILPDGMILISDIGSILSLVNAVALNEQLEELDDLGAAAGAEFEEPVIEP